MKSSFRRNIRFNNLSIECDGINVRSPSKTPFKSVTADNHEVGYVYYDKVSGEKLEKGSILKGIKLGKNEYIKFTQEELTNLDMKKSDINLMGFIGLGDLFKFYNSNNGLEIINSIYSLIPTSESEEFGYSLLTQALIQEKKVGLAKFVNRSKEHIAVIVPYGNGLGLMTIYYPKEIKKIETKELKEVKVEQLEKMRSLISSMNIEISENVLIDRANENLKELIRLKESGEEIPIQITKSESKSFMDSLNLAITKKVG